MKYKELGKTGLKISVVSFGGIPIQRIDDEEASKVIIHAEEKGMNFIDTARGYTVSEEFIGKALEGRREKWIIATKSMARDKQSMTNDVNISLSNLRTDYIDLYQFHNIKTIEEYDKVLGENGAYEALEEFKDQGKIGHIGITSHSLDILKIAVESGKFETIMYPYNIIENQGEEVFKRASELGIGVIAMKPIAGGAFDKGTLALKYILNNNSVTCAIPGMGKVEEVEENCNICDKDLTLTEDDLKEIKALRETLGTEFCRRCGYCAPCPKGIDIPNVFVFQAYKERYNLREWAEARYSSLKATAKDCIECGSCEGRCPYNLPIRNMLKKARKTFNE